MKKAIFFILLILSFNLHASVYDFIRNRSDFSLPFISNITEKMNVRINDQKMTISLIESDKSSKEVLDSLYCEAEKKNCVFYSNELILSIADLLYKIAGKKKYEDEFGYLFYRDKKDKICFFITAGDGYKSEIIKIVCGVFKNKKIKGVNDGIEHLEVADKVMSVEILSDSDKTIYFANFYRVLCVDRYEIRRFYSNSLKKSKFKILKKYFSDEIDFFMVEKKNKNYLLAISEQGNENWILITG